MDTQWIIIILVCLSLVGSVAWVMPTPLQRAQAKIRHLAMAKGFQVKVGKLQGPREQGEIAPESHLATSYGLPRPKDTLRGGGMASLKKATWEIFKTGGLNTKGLPQGWCWNRGEGSLSAAQLSQLEILLGQLPSDVYALAITPIMAQIYWYEKATPQELDDVEKVLQELVAGSF